MCFRRVPYVIVAFLAGICLWPGLAPTARAGQIRRDADSIRDVLQTVQARKLLAEDPNLAELNIGVTVADRVAVLWGPVASAEIAFRAELCLKTMIELVEVRNELFVCDQQEPFRPPLRIDVKPSFLPDRIPPQLPPPPLRPLPGAPGMLMRNEVLDAKKKTVVPIKAVPSEKLALPALGSPLPEKTLNNRNGTQAEQEIAAAVRKVLQGKEAYRDVQFAVQEGRVYLRAANEVADALHDAAREIARLPNVVGVILSEKTSP